MLPGFSVAAAAGQSATTTTSSSDALSVPMRRMLRPRCCRHLASHAASSATGRHGISVLGRSHLCGAGGRRSSSASASASNVGASRDPDCVSTLPAADEAAALSASAADSPSSGTRTAAAVQDTGFAAAAQPVAVTVPDSQADGSQQHSGTSSSKGFGVTVEQLRQLVQAGVDDSQADAAAGVMQALAQRLQERQQRKQRKHSKAAPDGGSLGSGSSSLGSGVYPAVGNGTSSSSTTNGTTAPTSSSSSSTSGLAQLPRALASALGSSLSSGLPGTSADTAARVAAFGSNSLAAAATSSFWQLLLEAASDSTLLLLMAAGAVSLGLAASTGKEAVDYIDGAAILASVAICVTVTAVTNYQKEAKFRQLNSLKENIPVRVIRGGVELALSCFDLLVGDVLLVESGDILPADGLLFAGGQIKVDESHLTGESDDVVKEPPAAATAAAAGSNGSSGSSSSSGLSSCLCMSGSKVLEGFGRMLVLAVGPNSQQGMIQQMVLNGTQQQQQPGAAAAAAGGSSSGGSSSMLREATPLMSRLEDVANGIGGVGLAAAVGVLAVNSGLYTAELVGSGLSPWTSTSLEEYLSFFITSMTLLVVAVPEGLPLAVTLALAFSVQRMLADNNLVRNLSSCETMAAATAICSDKTGTLTENNMAVVKLLVGGATFNVRPSTRTAAAAAAAAAPGSSSSSRDGRQDSPFGVSLGGGSNSSGGSTRTPTLRSTSSIAAVSTSGTESEEENEAPGAAAALAAAAAAAAAPAGSSAFTSSQNGSGSSSSGSSALVSTTSSSDAAGWRPPSAAAAAAASMRQEGGAANNNSSSSSLRPDTLTMVSLSLDGGDPLGSVSMAAVEHRRLQQKQQEAAATAAAADGGNNTVTCLPLSDNDSGSDSELLTATGSFLGPLPTAAAGVEGASVLEGAGDLLGGLPPTPRLSTAVKQLLSDSISLNSTASIRLVDPDSAQEEAQQGGEACAVPPGASSSGRQLDRSGNRTECALLEFGGRLEGRLLPGCGSAEQQRRVLQVFPFSSTRKRMSSLVATGPPVSTPGTGGGGQPARLYVKGAAELLLDSCRLQVALDGSLVPLPQDQVTQLKARCGRGGLRVLALAYKDMLLPPAAAAACQPGARSSSGGSSSAAGASGQQQQQASSSGSSAAPCWELLGGDDEQQQDLVLIALLALEDPVRTEVPGAIRDCQRAGIAVRMITGDNAATGAAIAADCGILPPGLAQQIEATRQEAASNGGSGNGGQQQQQQIAELKQLLSGMIAAQRAAAASSRGSNGSGGGWLEGVLHQLGAGPVSGGPDPDAGAALMSSVAPDPRLAVLEGPAFRALVLRPGGSTDLDAFAALWPHLRVMARCTPADKFTLVQAVKALRARGELMETIAVTGDGTNDAPALNAADVGFAMAAGTSIAKDASDILLLDNNFRSIVSAVKWGRNVYSSVTKFLQFQLTANVVALVTAAGGALALRASPLSAVQMLWVNLIMDSLASLALATEAPTDSMLDEPPRVRDGPIITPTVAKSIVGQAALQLSIMAALLGPLGEALTHHDNAAAAVTGAAAGAGAAVTDAALGVAAAAMAAAGGLSEAAAAAGGGGVGLVPDRVEQYTLVFNSFVLMQLFNQLNSRKIHDEPNVLEGLSRQRLFLIILALELGLQVAIVEAGGRAFSTVPLSGTQWAVCVGFGGLTLLLRQALRAVPTEPPPPGGSSSSDGSSSGRLQQQWQQGAAAAMAAVRAAAAAPVQALRGAAAVLGTRLAVGGARRGDAAVGQQPRSLQQPARR